MNSSFRGMDRDDQERPVPAEGTSRIPAEGAVGMTLDVHLHEIRGAQFAGGQQVVEPHGRDRRKCRCGPPLLALVREMGAGHLSGRRP